MSRRYIPAAVSAAARAEKVQAQNAARVVAP
jgi:hypothetical protein